MKKLKIGLQIIVIGLLFVIMNGKVEAKAEAEEVWIEWEEEYSDKANQYRTSDLYYFYIDKSSKVTITSLDSSGQGFNEYWLYKIDMYTDKKVSIGHVSIKEKGSVSVTLGEGYYYFYLYNFYDSRVEFKLTCQPCNPDTDEMESNNTFDTAQEIKANILYTGDWNCVISVERDEDYYKIKLEENGLIWLETFGKMEIIFYREDEYLNTYSIIEMKSLEGEYCSSDRIRLPKGTYYVNVHAFDFCSLGDSYKFKVNYEKIDTAVSELESNNILQEATSIKTNQTYTGNSETATDVDYYKFTLDQTSKVQLRFDQPRGTTQENYYIELIEADDDEREVHLDKFTTTSNPVNFGKEVILEAGTYYVKVTGQEADSFIDYKLKVSAEKYILVKEIKLTTSTKTFSTGTIFTLKATVTPSNAIDKTITWSTSDDTVATVNKNGKVTCIKPGECYIYAKANDASGVTGKYLLVVGKNKTNTLSKVAVSAGKLSPEFDKSQISYTIQLDKDTSKVTIKWARSSTLSKAYVNDQEASKVTVSVKPGQKKTVEVVVVSESGAERTYKFVVERAYK